jgi:NAD+ synthase
MCVEYLVRFLKKECKDRRNTHSAVLGLSGGIDSAVAAELCVRAFGADNVYAFQMPYKLSSQASLDDALYIARRLNISERTIDITPMVDGYALLQEPEGSAQRIGNICSRSRAAILFDQSMKLGALPIGTGNKSERLLGYFTWHGDDSPPINPLGDLFKTQVYALARFLGVPDEILNKPPSADLVLGQTDEGDLGISYEVADPILAYLVLGYSANFVVRQGFDPGSVARCYELVNRTHWKRKLPTVAMMSTSAINEFYLRPVDY